LSYVWSTGATTAAITVTPYATTSYSVTITDANGCNAASTFTIPEPTALVTSSSSTPIACNGGNSTVTINANGGTSPYTGTGNYTVNAGNYSYNVTDANGCTSTQAVGVIQPTLSFGFMTPHIPIVALIGAIVRKTSDRKKPLKERNK
jgi:hypothetical protein